MGKFLWALTLVAGVAFASGNVIDIQDWPSAVQVEYYEDGVWSHRCTGSILTTYHFVTAANCFSGELYAAENRRVRSGASLRGLGGIISGVRYAHIHPNFGLLGHDSDITVVQVEFAFLINGDTINQVQIMGEGIEMPPGLPLDLVAWGQTAVFDGEQDDSLNKQLLIVHDYENCLTQYLLASQQEFITENMICVGRSYLVGRDYDSNDLGAPVAYQNVLAGVLTFGREADNEYPVVATAISPFTSWIIETAEIMLP